MSFLKPVHVIPPAKPNGFEHKIVPNRWWHPGDRRKAKLTAFVLETLRHPAARESLEETGNRKERRASRVAPGQLDKGGRRR